MSYIGNQPTNTAFLIDTFSGNSVTTSFTLSVAPATANSILVTIGGILQDTSAYGVNGRILTFSGVPPTGTNNISVRFLGLPASNITTPAYRTVTDLTATAGQTTFSTAGYTPGFIDVYRNGVKLAAGDFTATNGAQVVLASPAFAGDTIQTVSFFVSSVVNAIPGISGSIGSTYLDVTGQSGIGAMQLPVGTTVQRPATPTPGYTRYNTTINVVESWHPTGWIALSNVFQATGGTESTYVDGAVTYKVHIFTASGNFTVQSGSATVDYLVIAGGGGGGCDRAGGGGAGGYLTGVASVSPGTFAITVGSGGAGATGDTAKGGSGNNSVFGSFATALGGGGGGSENNTAGVAGGSGGGAAYSSSAGGSGTAGQGNQGGSGLSSPRAPGGGGGAGQAGQNGAQATMNGGAGARGGNGLSSSITGSAVVRAGGGGAGSNIDGTGGPGFGAGGDGGGGNGGVTWSGSPNGAPGNGSPGTANTGGGGGGGTTADSGAGGQGGSGIVIIRYQI